MAEVIVGLHKEIESLKRTPEEKELQKIIDEKTYILYEQLGIKLDKEWYLCMNVVRIVTRLLKSK